MTRVAIIEHDLSFAAEIRAAVESAGLQTDCFTEARAALPDVRREAFALAILGLDIPDADPFDVCREASSIVPVIVIGCRRDEETCLRAFEAGADDCLARPIVPRELGARALNLLRRAGRETSGSGELASAVSAMRVRFGTEMRDLSRGEAEILELLVESRGAPLTVVQMLDRLPPRSRVKRGTMESRIKSLRRKLGPERLVSRGRFGYQLAE